jgi:hypothetical protein
MTTRSNPNRLMYPVPSLVVFNKSGQVTYTNHRDFTTQAGYEDTTSGKVEYITNDLINYMRNQLYNEMNVMYSGGTHYTDKSTGVVNSLFPFCVAEIITNIPTAALAAGATLTKSAGTIASAVNIDWMSLSVKYTTPR